MSNRKHKFVKKGFYHIYVHSVGGLKLFNDNKDYQRFLTLIFVSNGIKPIPRLDRKNAPSLTWDIRDGKLDLGTPLVGIINFCFMPNHFHLLLEERSDGGISKYLQKLLTSHAKYYNLRHERRGHLFESNFHSRCIDTNNYLLRVSSYLHKNPKDILRWKNNEDKYPWSSYQDFIHENRWGKLLSKNIIEGQFKNKKDYQRFIEEHYEEVIKLP
jgi:putative transposase